MTETKLQPPAPFLLVGSGQAPSLEIRTVPHAKRFVVRQDINAAPHLKEPTTQISLHAAEWAETLFKTYVTGTIDAEDALHTLTDLKDEVMKLAFVLVGQDEALVDAATTLLKESHASLDSPIENQIQALPQSAEAFNLYNPTNGRTRLIPSFQEQLSGKIAGVVRSHLKDFFLDNDPTHLKTIARVIRFAPEARLLYTSYSEKTEETSAELLNRLKKLGLTKNLVTEGEGANIVQKLVKSDQFGRLTPEDRGKRGRSTPKNTLITGETPSLRPITTPISDTSGKPLDAIQDPKLHDIIAELTANPEVRSLQEKYNNVPEVLALIDWTAEQTIVRQYLPREATIPTREIDMRRLKKIMTLNNENSSDTNFQASNPLSLWVDPETNQKYIVKHCPEQTLQADYFGLEMLQLTGVPIYEFYYGSIPNEKGNQNRVLVSAFLEGFTDPSALVALPEGSPPGQAKTILPEHLTGSPYIQRAMLVEILIGEYNSKAHNFMVLGDSVQHIDQGGALTSTASGKFKGFGEAVTAKDIEDVLHCYTDWNPNAREPVNQAYARVAEVVDEKLIIHDPATAKRLLHQLQRIPQEKIDEALEQAGYEDGPESIRRMQQWIGQIDQQIIPRYHQMPDSERRKQYLRWSESAKQTFNNAIAMGGELSYYKQALKTRRASLEPLWQRAIDEAESKTKT